jgi:hypothetical protein
MSTRRVKGVGAGAGSGSASVCGKVWGGSSSSSSSMTGVISLIRVLIELKEQAVKQRSHKRKAGRRICKLVFFIIYLAE